MEREGAKPLEGRVAWLILLVVVSMMCVVFCALPSNRRLETTVPFFPDVIFSSCAVVLCQFLVLAGNRFWFFGARFRYKLMYYYFYHRSDLREIIQFLRKIECIEFECNQFVLVLVKIDLIHFEHSICISST